MKAKKNPITPKQMASIHVAYRLFAEMLNDAGYDLVASVKQGKLGNIPIPFTEENVKQIFGHTLIRHLFPIKFPEDYKGPLHPNLNTVEEGILFEGLNATMIKLYGISMPHPHKEEDDAT